MEIRGIYPVLLTLFDEKEQIDLEAMDHLVEVLIARGAHGITIFGIASEFYKLNDAERQQLLRHFLRTVNGRVPTIVSITAHGTQEACRRAREAEEEGAGALMILPPFFAHPDSGSVLRHVEQILKTIHIPAIIQYAPDETGFSVSAEVFVGLTAHARGELYCKVESTPAGPLISHLTRSGLKVLAGKGGIAFYEALLRGAVGLIPGCSLFDQFVEIFNAFARGDAAAASARHQRIVPYLSFVDQSTEMFLAAEKYFVRKRGFIREGHPRHPSFALESVHRTILDELFEYLALG